MMRKEISRFAVERLLLLTALLLSVEGLKSLSAQDINNLEIKEKKDTLRLSNTEAPDTVMIETVVENSPGLASLYSAVLPGLGQAYNGKHWKIPIIYGAFVTFGFLIYDNNVKYQYFRNNLIAELDSNPETINDTGRDANNLRSNRDQFRRNRDFNMILLTVTYFLQIADAHIDAHLMEFNVNQDISVFVDPVLMPANKNLAPGFTLKMNLR